MTKIKSITVQNFKAIGEQAIDLNGASAIIIAGNNKGKTSLLRGLIDRFRGEKPEIILKEGEEKGINLMELTDGSKIEWAFTEKTERFSYTTAEEIKMTSGVLSKIGKLYFGIKFDIDRFIGSSNSEQVKQVQELLGIDLSALDNKYKEKYSERTIANAEVKRLLALDKKKPEKVEVPNIDEFKKEKDETLKSNLKIKQDWTEKNQVHQNEILAFNQEQDNTVNAVSRFKRSREELIALKGGAIATFIDYDGIEKFYKELPTPQTKKDLTSLEEPSYTDVSVLDSRLEEAYQLKSTYDAYEEKLKSYNKWVKEGKQARKKVDGLNDEMQKIQEEKVEKLKSAKLPEEFELTDGGLTYNGFPLEDSQISSSAKYIAALKLGSLVLGKVKSLHFDASFLDKNSLSEVQKWAEEQKLQLLIERPDFEGGEITYNIIEK